MRRADSQRRGLQGLECATPWAIRGLPVGSPAYTVEQRACFVLEGCPNRLKKDRRSEKDLRFPHDLNREIENLPVFLHNQKALGRQRVCGTLSGTEARQEIATHSGISFLASDHCWWASLTRPVRYLFNGGAQAITIPPHCRAEAPLGMVQIGIPVLASKAEIVPFPSLDQSCAYTTPRWTPTRLRLLPGSERCQSRFPLAAFRAVSRDIFRPATK
jgi:hypothetical protein